MAKGAAAKAQKDVAKSGTHVPEKDFSSSKKVAAAAGTGGTKKGSMTEVKKLGSEKGSSAPEKGVKAHDVPYHEPQGYEGSMKDWSDDHREARRRGQSTSDYEDSARDRIADNAGERRMASDNSETEKHPSGYKAGVSAFSNAPKTAHGFGHSGAQKKGHLRCSGAPGAHQIGCKK